MNSKLIAIIAVVAMCGAALVGVGYAYSATYEDSMPSANVEVAYVSISGNELKDITNLDLKFDTTRTNVKIADDSTIGEGWTDANGSALVKQAVVSGTTYFKYELNNGTISFKNYKNAALEGTLQVTGATEDLGTGSYTESGVYYKVTKKASNDDAIYDIIELSFTYVLPIKVVGGTITMPTITAPPTSIKAVYTAA